MNIVTLFRMVNVMVALAMGWVSETPAQQRLPPELAQAVAQITQNDVTATVTFLASDEMAGRDTPSPELTIASAYVAARFRGAGLSGGANGSFYQKHQLKTEAMPSAGIAFTVDGQPAEHFGVLAADLNDFVWFGRVTQLEAVESQSEIQGAVLVDASAIESPRDLFIFRRQLSQLANRGAKCILLQVDESSPVVGVARQAAKPRLVNPRTGKSLPTLLVGPFDMNEQVMVKIPKRRTGQTEVRNVIGVLPGSDPQLKNEAVLFTAHLDHVGTQEGLKDPVFNGADDNATGVTAVIELAKAFGSLEKAPKRTTLFMTFWGEERGLLGSRYFANQPTWPLDQLVANINIEMVGRPEPGAAGKIWMTGWHQSDLGPMLADAAKAIDVRIFEHPQHSQPLYRASDNYSFVEKGVVAHSFSAGSLHDDYHQPGDEWEKLELRHMTQVIQGLFVGSMPLANGEVTPKPSPRAGR